jgi:hypothetical protein
MVRMTLPVAIGCAWFALLTLGGTTAWPQQVASSKDLAAAQTESKISASLHRIFRREMSAYSFYLDAEKQQKLIMRPEPVLRYPAPPEDCWGEIQRFFSY